MATARVLMRAIVETYVQVEISDDVPEDERFEYAIEAAYENKPRDICAQCSGWGQSWSRDMGESEVPEVGEDGLKEADIVQWL